MRKGVLWVAAILILCLSTVSALSSYQTSQHANASLNFSYSGFDDPLLDYTSSVDFIVEYRDSSNQAIGNTTGSCALNFTAPSGSSIPLNYSVIDEQYWANITYANATLGNQFTVECLNSANSTENIVFFDENGIVTFEYDVFAPIIVDVYGENDITGSEEENRSIISGLPYPFYVHIQNITGLEVRNVTQASCFLNIGSVNESTLANGFGAYFLAEPIVLDVGQTSYNAICVVNGSEYESPTQQLTIEPLFFDSGLINVASASSIFDRQPILLIENGSHSYIGYNPFTDTTYTVVKQLFPTVKDILTYSHTPRRSALAFADLALSSRQSLLFSGQGSNPTNEFQYLDNNFSANNFAKTSLSSVRWPRFSIFDSNNDGTLEVLVTGLKSGTDPYTRLLEGSSLNITNTSLPDLQDSSICHGDFTNDTYFDFFVTGNNGSSPYSAVYSNNGTDFELYQTLSPALQKSTCAIGRFLNNSKTQLVHFGTNSTDAEANWQYTIYADIQNLTNVWNGTLPDFRGPIYGDILIADFTSDGFADIIACGGVSGNGRMHFFVNDLNGSGRFLAAEVFNQSYALAECALSAADYDLNGMVDLALTGIGNGNPIRLFNNTANLLRTNTPPQPPESVTATWNASTNQLAINWSAGTDDSTPQSSLSYNLEVLTQDGELLLSGQPVASSKPAQGHLGNMQFRLQHTLKNVTNGNVKIRVQAIDAGLLKGAWKSIYAYSDACQPSANWTIRTPEGCQLSENVSNDSRIRITNGSTLIISNPISLGTNTTITVENGTLNISGITLNGTNSSIYLSQSGLLFANRLTLTGIDLESLSPVTLIDSRIEQFRSSTTATFINTTWATLNVSFPVDVRYYVNFAFTSQFGQSIDSVAIWNITNRLNGSLPLNLTAFLVNYSTNASVQQNLTFEKSGYYNKSITFSITGNEEIAVTFLKNPIPITKGFNVSGLPSEPLTGDVDSDVANYSFVENIRFWKANIGSIQFTEPVNVSFANLSQVITIQPLRIGVDSESARGLNRSANLTFQSLSFTAQPIALRNGALCSDCLTTRYNGTELDLTVDEFSNYTLNNNSELSLTTSSVYFNASESNFTVSYTSYGNASAIIQNADCSVRFTNDSISRQLAETTTGYSLSALFTEVEDVNASVRCLGNSSYEPLNQTFSLGVVRNGVYLLKESEYTGAIYTASIFLNDSHRYGFWLTGATDLSLQNSISLSIPSYIGIDLQSVDASASIVDIDNDGRSDLLWTSGNSLLWYANLTEPNVIETSLSDVSFAHFDYDFDGDTDILVCGLNQSTEPKTLLLQNRLADDDYYTGVSFRSTPHGFANVSSCSIITYKETTSTLIAVAGIGAGGNETITIYRINATDTTQLAVFSNWQTSGVSLFVADLTEDSFPEIILAGRFNESQNTSVYTVSQTNVSRNSDFSTQLPILERDNSIAYARLTNASNRTLIISGQTNTEYTTKAYTYNGTGFAEQDITIDLPGTIRGSLQLGDLDKDSDLDVLITGISNGDAITELYNNTLAQFNQTDTKPTSPQNITATYANGTLLLNWTASSDTETPQGSLTYNLRIGNNTNPNRFVSGILSSATRPRTLPTGNAGKTLSINYTLPNACFSIQAQAIDSAWQQSQWSQQAIANNQTETCNGFDNDCDGVIDEDFYYPGTDLFIYNGSTFVCEFYEIYDQQRLSCPNTPTDSPGSACQTTQYSGAVYIWNMTTKLCDCDTSSATPKNVQDSTQRGTGGSFSSTTSAPVESTEEQPDQEQPVESSSDTTPVPTETINQINGFEIFQSVTYGNSRTTVTEVVKNIERTQKYGVTVTKNFPKEILQAASKLKSLNDRTIIQEDPIIEFTLSDLDYLQSDTLVYSIPGNIDQNQLNQVRTSIASQHQLTELQIQNAEQTKEQTAQQSIQLNLSETQEGNQTVLRLDLALADNVSLVNGVEIEQEIPKCLIQEITDTILQSGIDPTLLESVEIKEADPIIVWKFEQINRGQVLELRLNALRDEDCDDENKIRALAENYIQLNQPIKYTNVIYTLLLTLATLAVVFLPLALANRHRFTSHDNPHVLNIAKAILKRRHLGETDADIRQHLTHNQELLVDIDSAIAHVEQHAPSKTLSHFLEKRVEIVIFLTLLVLSILELLGLLPGYLDWMKKVLSWVIMLTVLYHANLSRIFFNIEAPRLNIALLTGMFLMHLKNLVEFARRGLIENISFVYDAYTLILRHEHIFSIWLFWAGVLILTACVLNVVKRVPTRDGCLFGVICNPFTKESKVRKGILAWLLFYTFFFAVFNRLMEWLAIAVDSAIFVLTAIALLLAIFSAFLRPNGVRRTILGRVERYVSHHMMLLCGTGLLAMSLISPILSDVARHSLWGVIILIVLSVAAYVLIKDRHEHYAHAEHVTVALDSLYEKFLKLFKYPMTIPLAISGILILQQIVELVLFLIPNITGESSLLYGAEHSLPFLNLFGQTSIVAQHLFSMSLFDQFIYGSLYIISLLGIGLLFLIPVFLWALYYAHRNQPLTHLSIPDTLNHSRHWITAVNRVLPWTIPILITGLLTQVLSIQATRTGTVGLSIEVAKIPLTTNSAYILLGSFLLSVSLLTVVTQYSRFKKDVVVFTLWLGMLLNILLYLIPYLGAVTRYLQELVSSLPQLTYFAAITNVMVSVGWGLDIIIVYLLGGGILIYLALPESLKAWINSQLGFAQARPCHLLEYYDDARHHLSGNLVHHLQHYLKREIENGYSKMETIQHIRKHGYPEKVIHQL